MDQARIKSQTQRKKIRRWEKKKDFENGMEIEQITKDTKEEKKTDRCKSKSSWQCWQATNCLIS